MMSTAINNFAKQFEFKPVIENAKKLKKYSKFVIGGMGGSHLAGDLLKTILPDSDIIIHSNYGIPVMNSDQMRKRLFIASSYSGNTEESIDFFEKAKQKKLSLAVIAVGGKLIEMAKKSGVPYIQIPNTGIQPRSALGFSLVCLLKIMRFDKLLIQSKKLSRSLKPENFEKSGKELAQRLKNYIPVIYSSAQNFSLAYNWKIKFNENGKIPAFYNVFPELNHNEMNGFDVIDANKHLSDKFYFIFLSDKNDHPKNKKRMIVTKELYEQRGLKCELVELNGKNALEKIFNNLLLADWASHCTALNYGIDSEPVPMVEEFKRLIK